jgi:outer membrane translocation and assembly module TamA
MPRLVTPRVSFDVRGQWVDVPRMPFYGIGNDAGENNRFDFAYRATTVGATARVHAARLVAVGAGIDSLSTEAAEGLQPSYARTRLFAEFDSRTSPGYTRSGGFYRVDWADYRQVDAGHESFRRLDAEANHFVPLLRENWVIALRAMATTTQTAPGEHVPFFLLPDLGGNRALRGYSTWRFRDRNRMLLTGEYRWTAGQFVDMALFMDAGKVAARASDLNFDDLHTAYGLGVSFHTLRSTMTRIEVARSREGVTLSFAFGPSF